MVYSKSFRKSGLVCDKPALDNNLLCQGRRLLEIIEFVLHYCSGWSIMLQKSNSETKAMGDILVASLTTSQAVGHNFAQQTLHMCLLATMPNTFLCSDS